MKTLDFRYRFDFPEITQLLQSGIIAQKNKIIQTVPSRRKERKKRIHIVGLSILARSLQNNKMFFHRTRKALGPKGFHDQRKPTKRCDQNLGKIANQLERKDPVCYIHSAPPG